MFYLHDLVKKHVENKQPVVVHCRLADILTKFPLKVFLFFRLMFDRLYIIKYFSFSFGYLMIFFKYIKCSKQCRSRKIWYVHSNGYHV